ANAIMGKMDLGERNDLTDPFVSKLRVYEQHLGRARWEERPLVGSAGLMKGLVVHYWHGPRTGRQYGARGQILSRNRFDPDLDLKPDWQGLYQLTDRTPSLRRDIQQYFAQRNEDQV